MLICILGRQPELSLAELEAVYGTEAVRRVAFDVATVETDKLDLSQLGGTIKYGRILHSSRLSSTNDKLAFVTESRRIVQEYQQSWQSIEHKITLGISAYHFSISPRDVQKTGLLLKSMLKKQGVSLRLVPNSETALSTAVSHNNKLGLSDNKIELLLVKTRDRIILAQSLGAQNITAYARRDQNRPKRDAFVGMLPPKLAQIMLNLALPQPHAHDTVHTILDPFCGTGTVLQEALLRGDTVYGSDLNPKMISYTQTNLAWLQDTHHTTGTIGALREADATSFEWKEAKKLDMVVCETYLGQPFSAPPSPAKLKEVTGNCNHIISLFLENLHRQVRPGTMLCIAVPTWQATDGTRTHLPLVRKLSDLGYELQREPLVYARPDQVVGRELLVLKAQ